MGDYAELVKTAYDPLEANEDSMPFVVDVDYRPIGSSEAARFTGRMRADGAGSFDLA